MTTRTWQAAGVAAMWAAGLHGCGGAQRQPAEAPASHPQSGPPAGDADRTEEAPRSQQPAYPSAGAPAAEDALDAETSGPPGEGMLEDLDISERQLGDALSLADPNCELARALRDQICDLAARICELGDGAETAERCGAARASCTRATGRVRARCGS